MAVVDTSIVAEVRETLGDELYRSFVDRMLEEAGQVADRLKTLLQEDKLPELASLAHRMAGSAVSVGASGLHGQLKAIEDSVRLDAGAGLPEMIAALDAVIAQTAAALDDILR